MRALFAGLPAMPAVHSRVLSRRGLERNKAAIGLGLGQSRNRIDCGLRDFQKQELGGAPLAGSTVFLPLAVRMP